jgi:hypothetical protein
LNTVTRSLPVASETAALIATKWLNTTVSWPQSVRAAPTPLRQARRLSPAALQHPFSSAISQSRAEPGGPAGALISATPGSRRTGRPEDSRNGSAVSRQRAMGELRTCNAPSAIRPRAVACACRWPSGDRPGSGCSPQVPDGSAWRTR